MAQVMHANLHGVLRTLRLPEPDEPVLPGIIWGAFDELLTPPGIVRLNRLDLTDQWRSRLSRGELTPLHQSGRSVFLEDFTAI